MSELKVHWIEFAPKNKNLEQNYVTLNVFRLFNYYEQFSHSACGPIIVGL